MSSPDPRDKDWRRELFIALVVSGVVSLLTAGLLWFFVDPWQLSEETLDQMDKRASVIGMFFGIPALLAGLGGLWWQIHRSSKESQPESSTPAQLPTETPRDGDSTQVLHFETPVAIDTGVRGHGNGKPRRQWLGVGVRTLVVSAVAPVAAITIWAFVQMSTRGEPSNQPSGNTAAQTSAPRAHCREWVPIAQQTLDVRPCIKESEGQLLISADVRAFHPAPGSVIEEAAVWVWLMKVDEDLIKKRQFHLTRDASTLNSCTFRLKGDQVATCGPFLVRPPGPGTYAAAMRAALQPGEWPPGWDSPSESGTQSPKLEWRPG